MRFILFPPDESQLDKSLSNSTFTKIPTPKTESERATTVQATTGHIRPQEPPPNDSLRSQRIPQENIDELKISPHVATN